MILNATSAINIASFTVFAVVATAILSNNFSLFGLMFILTNTVIVWMVFKVLKSGKSSQYSFEEKQYENN